MFKKVVYVPKTLLNRQNQFRRFHDGKLLMTSFSQQKRKKEEREEKRIAT